MKCLSVIFVSLFFSALISEGLAVPAHHRPFPIINDIFPRIEYILQTGAESLLAFIAKIENDLNTKVSSLFDDVNAIIVAVIKSPKTETKILSEVTTAEATILATIQAAEDELNAAIAAAQAEVLALAYDTAEQIIHIICEPSIHNRRVAGVITDAENKMKDILINTTITQYNIIMGYLSVFQENIASLQAVINRCLPACNARDRINAQLTSLIGFTEDLIQTSFDDGENIAIHNLDLLIKYISLECRNL